MAGCCSISNGLLLMTSCHHKLAPCAAARNYITGTLPDAIRNLTKLAELQLDRNTMMGTIPEWLTELPLQWLALNRLRGGQMTVLIAW